MNNQRKLSSSKLENCLSPDSYESCDSEHEVIEIMTSDLDSEALKILSPSTIQRQLLHLAHSHTQNGHQPVKGISSHHTKNFSGRNRVETIHDSLSPKCRKWRVSNREMGAITGGRAGRGQQIATTCDNAKNMSEKMADAVFERILPYIPTEDLSSSAIPPITPLHLYVDKNIEELDQRFHRLQSAVKEAAEFVAQERPTSGPLLRNVIQNANISLGKMVETNQVFRPPLLSLEERMMDLPFETNSVVKATSRPHQDGISDGNRHDKGVFQTSSLWNDIRLQKLNFWRSLIDNQYIPSVKNEITNKQSCNQIPREVNSDEGTEILKESKKGETLRITQNSV